MTKGKGSVARYKAMLVDVEKRARYALSSGVHANPYPNDDKRHDRFARKLRHLMAGDSDFEDMCEVYGCDTSTWVKRKHPHPGPVVPLAQLC